MAGAGDFEGLLAVDGVVAGGIVESFVAASEVFLELET